MTGEEIEELKARYGRLFKIDVCGTTYLCRLLYKQDWDAVTKMRADNPRLTMAEFDEKIVGACVLGPLPAPEEGGWATRPAGVTPTLSQVIRAKSGFIVPEAEEYSTINTEDVGDQEEAARPSEEEIAALQAMSQYPLKGISFGSDYFVVRGVARLEFKQIIQGDPEDQDMLTAEKAVLWPKKVDWAKKPAGYCDTISQFVMAISGFSGPTAVEDL